VSFDKQVPPSLKNTQVWFGSIIGRAIDENSQINPITPSGRAIEEEAWDFIRPSPSLRPAQRIQIYNQQYWWRLLSALQETFPVVTRLFGYHDFNRSIAIPYLEKYPPNHWSLALLGRTLPFWIEENYTQEDKNLVSQAANLDWAFNEAFLAKDQMPILQDSLPKEGVAGLLDVPLYLQSHVQLLELDFDLFPFRVEMCKQDPDYWIENDFPPLKKEKNYAILYRDSRGDVLWDNVSHAEYQTLRLFKNGQTVEKACEWLENQDTAIYEEATEKLPVWFRDWIFRRYFSLC